MKRTYKVVTKPSTLSSRELAEFTKALLGRHASVDRAPSCAGSPAGRWSPRR